MIVCHCAVVTSADIVAALEAGARSVSEVCSRTGAAQNCGTCIFSVKQVVCQHEPIGPPHAEETISAAS